LQAILQEEVLQNNNTLLLFNFHKEIKYTKLLIEKKLKKYKL